MLENEIKTKIIYQILERLTTIIKSVSLFLCVVSICSMFLCNYCVFWSMVIGHF